MFTLRLFIVTRALPPTTPTNEGIKGGAKEEMFVCVRAYVFVCASVYFVCGFYLYVSLCVAYMLYNFKNSGFTNFLQNSRII